MSLDNPKAGLGYVAEYQSSALPFLTTSLAPAAVSGTLRIDFPRVSRFITISNNEVTGTYLRLGFTRNGVMMGTNFYKLNGGGVPQSFELRVTSMHLAGESGSVNFSVAVGLTNIDAIQMPVLTGTLPTGGTGWLGVG